MNEQSTKIHGSKHSTLRFSVVQNAEERTRKQTLTPEQANNKGERGIEAQRAQAEYAMRLISTSLRN